MRHSSAPSPWKGRFRHEPRVRARRYNESIIRLIGDAACGSTAGFDPEADVLLSRFSYGRSVSLLTDVRIAPCEPKFDELRYLENPRIAAYRRPGARTHISRFVGAPSSEIDERLRDLKREWDIERTLEANVARVALLGFRSQHLRSALSGPSGRSSSNVLVATRPASLVLPVTGVSPAGRAHRKDPRRYDCTPNTARRSPGFA